MGRGDELVLHTVFVGGGGGSGSWCFPAGGGGGQYLVVGCYL